MNDTLFCYKSVTDETKCMSSSTKTGMYVVGVCNAVLAVPTAAANALVILAILTTSNLRTPSYLLLTSLALCDFVVGILGQPFLSAVVFGTVLHRQIYHYFLLLLSIAAVLTSCVSVLTLTAISVDRYLAIRLKMRYKTWVTVRRTRFFVIIVWTFAGLFTSYILLVRKISKIVGILIVFFITMFLIVIVVSYTMSFRALKIHCAQTHPQGNQQQPISTTQSNAIDVLKYRKLLKTMALVVMLVFICYLPLIAIFFIILKPPINGAERDFWSLITIMTLNSTFNPVIYITRMRDIRQACTRILKKMLS